MPKTSFKVCSIFDTETTNIGTGADTRAFTVSYQFNDLRDVDLSTYSAELDNVLIYRYAAEALNYIDSLIDWGIDSNVVPIVCGYNLMFDLQTLMYELAQAYIMKVNAQSSTNVYTLDLYIEDRQVLRFWDTYHLEMRGLEAMGNTAGMAKATGKWDYSKIRTPETPLTQKEIFYAARDVQVIPAYLRFLIESNEWLTPEMLGVNVITKTSLVRNMATLQIGTLRITKRNGAKQSLLQAFEYTCMRELPRDFQTYGLRKACFRGGFTFTAAKTASVVVENVASLDVTSMHHTFINGMKIPMHFKKLHPALIRCQCERILNTDLDYVLSHYNQPFYDAFHARIEFTDIRLKQSSIFAKAGIALIPEGKFSSVPVAPEYGTNEAVNLTERLNRLAGWHDVAYNPTFALGKLYKADRCILHVSEIELWTMAQVYEWHSYRVILGEGSLNFKYPPDYVTLQSNILYETKNDCKQINNHYEEGKPYPYEIPATIPAGIAATLQDGTCSAQFFNGYYNSTIKGMFNGIYGVNSQDVYKCSYKVDLDGTISVDMDTAPNAENFESKKPKNCRVLYTYGLRIVGRSRMHLVIAMILLDAAFGPKVQITGGDTDSIKIACDDSVTDSDLSKALEPIAKASKNAINLTMQRVRHLFPEYASTLHKVGSFDIENEGNHYKLHMDTWNKARVSLDKSNKAQITCAGISRNARLYNIEHYISDMSALYGFRKIAPLVLGYDSYIDNSIAHALQHHRPKFTDVIEMDVTDYLGNTTHVKQYEAIALYPTGRALGELDKRANAETVQYLQDTYNRQLPTYERTITIEAGVPKLLTINEWGEYEQAQI